MSDVSYRTAAEIVSAAWDRLIQQFRRADNLKGYIGGLLDPFAVFETGVSDVRDGLNVDDATGDLLDKLGKLVGEDRQGRSDAVYRVFVKARILINLSEGRASDVINLLTVLTSALAGYAGTAADVDFREYHPATFEVTYEGLALTADDVSALQKTVTDTRAGGVSSRLIYSTTTTPLFRFAGSGVTGADNGFGNGHWAAGVNA